MEFSVKFIKRWWWSLLGIVTLILIIRTIIVKFSNYTTFDIVVFIVWIGLALTPLYSELNIFGFSWRKEPKIIPPPLPTEEEANKIIQELQESGAERVITGSEDESKVPNAPDPTFSLDVALTLNNIWLDIFNQITRIAETVLYLKFPRSGLPLVSIFNALEEQDRLEKGDANHIMNVIQVCRRSRYGKDVSKLEFEFVRKHASDIIRKLERIK